MKKLYTTLVLVLALAYIGSAQTVLFSEDFSSGVPPTGWSIDAHAGNWSQQSTSTAGGDSPEARFSWSPQFNGASYLISPQTITTGYTSLGFSFRHSVDHYGGAYTLGVATRSAGGAWTNVWQLVNPSGSIPAEFIDFQITNSDVGAADFEIAIFFSGDSYNINYWYIDDAKLYVPLDHDVAAKSILGGTYFDMGDEYIAAATVGNVGLNAESFDATLEIYGGLPEVLLFTETLPVADLPNGQETTLTFAGYTLPTANEIYNIKVFTSLTGDMNLDNDTTNKYIYTYTTERGMVLLEIGTGTWCQFCPGAAMGADDLLDEGHNVAVIENHNGDTYANTYSDYRNDIYYGIGGYPTAFFDGVVSVIGGSNTTSMYTTYQPIADERAAIRSAFDVDLWGSMTAPGEFDLLGTVTKLGPAMNQNVVLHIVLTESHIMESWQGQDHLNFVTRLMMPDQFGTALDVVNNDYIEVSESFTMDASWVTEECELVYFLQDNDTKEILQGGKVMVTDLIGVGVDEELTDNGIAISRIYPNPFSDKTNINFSIVEAGNVVVSIHDMTGRELSVLSNEVMTAGEHQISWEAGNVPNGIYFCTISTADNKITQKVMLSK